MVLYVATIVKNEAYKYQGPKITKIKKNPGASKFWVLSKRNKKFKAEFCHWTT